MVTMNAETLQAAAQIKELSDDEISEHVSEAVGRIVKKNAHLIKGAALESKELAGVVHLEVRIDLSSLPKVLVDAKGCLEPLKLS
jgi:hypothetical protein